MREIKFRQWARGRFHYFGFTEPGCFIGPITSNEEAHANTHQFTGLRDKNGKEIYEGDIVKGSAGWLPVEWRGAQWGFSNVMWNEKIEVIGNIHENPELLNPSIE